MKKFFCMTGMVAILAAVCIFGVGCGNTKILSLYDSTFTFTGKTLSLEWDKNMGLNWHETDSNKSVKELVTKYWDEIDWGATKEDWQSEMLERGLDTAIADGLTETTTKSVETFIAYFDEAIKTVYDSLKDVSVIVGSDAHTVEVTLRVPGRSEIKYILESRGVNSAGIELSYEYGTTHIEFATGKIAEYDALFFSVPAADLGLDNSDATVTPTVRFPITFDLLSTGGGLVSLCTAPEMTVS